ncbi:15672_t:CDS:2 [Gigaspora margarita]|uniref:15672_t:CDS:1 n=1 Tax=Gigaspora margarita TaxID=4874 RepID=A0ABN7UDH7_GIGMA|nr:15672_t:CDS:2 [Gigaspora margarita]
MMILRKLYTDDTSREVGDDVSELSLEEMVPTDSNYSGPSKKFSNKKNKGKEKATVSDAVSHSQLRRQSFDSFRNCELKTASGTKNAFDLMHPQKQKNARITDHNDAPNVSVGSSNAITKKKAGGSSIYSPAWKWFEEVYIDNIRHGVCNIEMMDGKACDIKLKTAKPHNTTEQAIHDKAITEVIVAQNLLLSFAEEKTFKRFTKIVDSRWIVPGKGKIKSLIDEGFNQISSCLQHDLHQAKTVSLTANLWTAYSRKGYLGIMATWINENFELNNAVLAVTLFRYPHIADAIAKYIENVLEHWNLKTKVFSITFDSGQI